MLYIPTQKLTLKIPNENMNPLNYAYAQAGSFLPPALKNNKLNVSTNFNSTKQQVQPSISV